MTTTEKIARQVRKDIIWSIYHAKSGHPGGSLSCSDILTLLFHRVMSPNKSNKNRLSDDYFILSKGHATPALYAVAASKGLIRRADLKTLRAINSPLQGHPDVQHTPWVDVSTGSLGQGFSVAVGIAKGLQLKNNLKRVFTLLGDGELQEGQIWEGAMFAGHHKLSQLTAIVDYNKLQSDATNKQICNLEPLVDKWRTFGWNVVEVDGHAHQQLLTTLMADTASTQPKVVIAHTVKGKGVDYMENMPLWHGSVTLSEQQYIDAMTSLGCSLAELEEYQNV
ncbi:MULTISPECIES: transketolase [Shewanella]|uniref:transketolase n=1 Tax=Shewanella TaxID=22 RepID=UPI00138F8C90|nr:MULTISPECIES: transketolase [Shewanella]MCL1161638.1 transketolase [Shewanella chilikensis]NDO76218.1 transketolase [Shewanella sp. SE1]